MRNNPITKSYIESRDTNTLWEMINGDREFPFMSLPHAIKVYQWVVDELVKRNQNN